MLIIPPVAKRIFFAHCYRTDSLQGVEHMTALASAMLTEYDQKNYAAWQAYHDVQAAHTAAEEAAEEVRVSLPCAILHST